MQRAHRTNVKINKKVSGLNESDFQKYTKNPNDFYIRLTNKRNRLIFRKCELRCQNLKIDIDLDYNEIEIINTADTDDIKLFDSGLIRPSDIVHNTEYSRILDLYKQSWSDKNKYRTLNIIEYRQLSTFENPDNQYLFEIWVRPNDHQGLGIVYFIKIENDKRVCIIPASWIEI